MRLPYKVFMASVLVIVALVGVATWSLLAVGRLVDLNRGIATQSLPALRMGTSLREQLGDLTRTDMDARRAAAEPTQRAWNERAARSFLVRLPKDVAPPVGAASAGGER